MYRTVLAPISERRGADPWRFAKIVVNGLELLPERHGQRGHAAVS